jgi:hypothetical protein
MAHGATLSTRKFLFVGEASSLDHRGREAAPTEKDQTDLEENYAWPLKSMSSPNASFPY